MRFGIGLRLWSRPTTSTPPATPRTAIAATTGVVDRSQPTEPPAQRSRQDRADDARAQVAGEALAAKGNERPPGEGRADLEAVANTGPLKNKAIRMARPSPPPPASTRPPRSPNSSRWTPSPAPSPPSSSTTSRKAIDHDQHHPQPAADGAPNRNLRSLAEALGDRHRSAVAARLDVTYEAARLWLTGARTVTPDVATRLARMAGKTCAELFTEADK